MKIRSDTKKKGLENVTSEVLIPCLISTSGLKERKGVSTHI